MSLSRLVLALSVALAWSMSAVGAEEKPAPTPISLSVGRTIRLQLPDKKPIKLVTVDNEGVVRATPALDDRTTVLLTGIAPGRARVTIVGDNGKKMVCDLGKR